MGTDKVGAVLRDDAVFPSEIVQGTGEPLGGAATVDEDQR